jgi:hypothetical protein
MLVTGGVLTWATGNERSQVTGAATYPDGTLKMTREEALDHETKANNYSKGSAAMYVVGGAATLAGLIWGIVDATRQSRNATSSDSQDGATSRVLFGASPSPGGVALMACGSFK